MKKAISFVIPVLCFFFLCACGEKKQNATDFSTVNSTKLAAKETTEAPVITTATAPIVSITKIPTEITTAQSTEEITDTDITTVTEIQTEAPTEPPTERSTGSKIVETIAAAIDGQVGSGEKITSVQLTDKKLFINVDLSGADTKFWTTRDIAISRLSSITDEILSLDKEVYDSWDTITVDYGNVGKAVLDKSMIKDDGYGKYFDFPDSIIK